MRLIQCKTVIYLLLIYIEHVASGIIYCCPPEQVLLPREDICWDPTTNTVQHIELKCQPVRFEGQFTINENMELVPHVSFYYGLGDELHKPYPVGSFCVANTTTTYEDVSLESSQQIALICPEEELINHNVLGTCLIISILFLTTTLIIYLVLPELRDLQGMNIINFCASLSIGQVILVIMQFTQYSNMALCATRGFLAYFFLTSAFFWTNAIAIQIFIQMRRAQPLGDSWRECMWYAIYAWGAPATLTVCVAIVNFSPGDHSKPGIGSYHCWFNGKPQEWLYFLSVVIILLVANICLTVYTYYVLKRRDRTSSHSTNVLRYRFIVSVRLTILMGVSGVINMIGISKGQHVLWSLMNMINCLQGLFIFLMLVVFDRRVITLMYRRKWLNCISGLVDQYFADADDQQHTII